MRRWEKEDHVGSHVRAAPLLRGKILSEKERALQKIRTFLFSKNISQISWIFRLDKICSGRTKMEQGKTRKKGTVNKFVRGAKIRVFGKLWDGKISKTLTLTKRGSCRFPRTCRPIIEGQDPLLWKRDMSSKQEHSYSQKIWLHFTALPIAKLVCQ